MELNLPHYVSIFFVITIFLTIYLFFSLLKKSNLSNRAGSRILLGLFFWVLLQILLSRLAIYSADLSFLPPKIVLFGIAPAMLMVILTFTLKNGRSFLNSLSMFDLHVLHIVRIPVEISLFFLAMHKTIPHLMTFEGANFDIFAGISAPIIAYFGIKKSLFNNKIILIWNFVCLLLLINIVIIAILAAPTPLQKLAFEQANKAIFIYPYSLLPTIIVPIVLFCQLASIRLMLLKKKTG